MKRFIYLFVIAALVVISACKKGAIDPAHPLIGKWKVNASYISPGGPGTWTSAPTNSNNYVQFDSNGNLKGNTFPGYSTYVYKDSVTLTFNGVNVNAKSYSYIIHHDTLFMEPAGPIVCTEGCAIRFIRER